MTIDLYTPWREDPGDLQARHIGHEDIRETLEQAGRRHYAGEGAVHVYLFGPRGMGKSHMLALTERALREPAQAAGLPLLLVPEDLPQHNTSKDLLDTLARMLQPKRWDSWKRAPVDHAGLRGAVVLFDGLDRQLNSLKEPQRRLLRAFVRESGVLLIATGVALSPPFTHKNSAFYGSFTPWPLQPLEREQADTLLESVAGTAVQRASWTARKSALLDLAGGSPRTLVALGQSCAACPGSWSSQDLYAVLQRFTAHYQMRFRDLAPQGQRVLGLLAEAPRQLSPKEIAQALGLSATAASTVARRLVDAGVVAARQEGRRTWYAVAEPLFRYWHEYRTAPWEQTRVYWLGRLLEAVAQPGELVSGWMETRDLDMRRAFEWALRKRPGELVEGMVSLVRDAGVAQTPDIFKEKLRKLADYPHAMSRLIPLFMAVLVRATFRIGREATPLLLRYCEEQDLSDWSIGLHLIEGIKRGAAEEAMRELLASPPTHLPFPLLVELQRALLTGPQSAPSWVPSQRERSTLSGIPFLRGEFLLQGLHPDLAPLLTPSTIPLDGELLDAWLLLPMAHVLQDRALFVAALKELPTRLPANPAPDRICPAPELLAQACFVGPQRAPVTEKLEYTLEVLSFLHQSPEDQTPAFYGLADDLSEGDRSLEWAASWAPIQADTFAALLERLTACASALPASDNVSTALLALGKRAPDRLGQVCDALRANKELHELAESAVSLTRQLQESSTAPLQPELQALAERLDSRERELA